MGDITDQILAELKELKSWLYGANGFEGDVPEIKSSIKDHSKRIRRIELIVAGSGIIGAGALGIINLLGG